VVPGAGGEHERIRLGDIRGVERPDSEVQLSNQGVGESPGSSFGRFGRVIGPLGELVSDSCLVVGRSGASSWADSKRGGSTWPRRSQWEQRNEQPLGGWLRASARGRPRGAGGGGMTVGGHMTRSAGGQLLRNSGPLLRQG
jgi:hypothetical protein